MSGGTGLSSFSPCMSEHVTRWGLSEFKSVKKNAIAPKSILECSDRSGNVIDRKDMNFYTKAMSQFFIQLHLSAEIGGCEVRNKFSFGFSMNFNVNSMNFNVNLSRFTLEFIENPPKSK